ncbi:galactose oxidase [Pedobacter ginsengisoli]|uniref:Galactose oxidase n=1 Tax=Pedobacter ginsengisoli TaxID=363852 RepID=A0A2D1U4A2_9SPHI|nr:kelch repeat-containing protein [Pedobacter ginsengisoli]ATP56426.1 galactose oxidase [Pedobacter ginsengisoli]
MNKYIFSLSIPFMLMLTDVSAQETTIKQVQWCTAAKLQNADGSTSLGFAGAVNAVFNDALMVAGGANFPDKMPWEGGKKYYSDRIQILIKQNGNFAWGTKPLAAKLPEPVAYCGNTATDLGVVYAGGEGPNGLSNKAFIINWDTSDLDINIKRLADLPFAVTNAGLTHVGNVVYLVGGDKEKNSSDSFYMLDLNANEASWEKLPDLPMQLANALVVAQANKIFVIGGRTKTASGISDLHHTTFAYDLKAGTWQQLADISDGKQITNFSAGAGVAVANDLILVAGGDNGEVFHKIENYISQIAKSQSQQEKDKLTIEKNKLSINHKGFYKAQLVYNVTTNKWAKIGQLPFLAHVTTTAAKWGNDIVLSNGEIKPGVRTPSVMIGKIETGSASKK